MARRSPCGCPRPSRRLSRRPHVPTTPFTHEPRSPERMTRILVVEDEVSLRTRCPTSCGRRANDVAVAETGPDALTGVRCQWCGSGAARPDASGPSRRGRVVPCARAPTCRSSCSPPKDSEIDKVVGLEMGADDYVTKPYSSRELLARIGPSAPSLRARGTAADHGRGGPGPDGRRTACRQRGETRSAAAQGVRAARDAVAQHRPSAHAHPTHRPRVGLPDYVGTPRPSTSTSSGCSQDRARPGNPRHIVTVRGLGYKFEQ